MATILLAGVDLFFRGKLDALLGAPHKLITTDSVDSPDLVICDLARIDPYEVADSWPEYNEVYAHPFEWTWTNQKMRRWFVRHGG